MKKILILLAKFAVSAAIISYLVVDAQHDKTFDNLAHQTKDWPLLTAAGVALLAAVVITFIRWFMLVRALNLPFSVREAMRLGFLGYLLNFVSLGSVGGDVFKAIFLARQLPGRRAEAVATVLLDRVVGLYTLFIMATVAIFSMGLLQSSIPEVRVISQVTVGCTAAGAVGILMLLVPGFTQGRVSEWLAALPKLGPLFRRLIDAVRLYRQRWMVLTVCLLMTVAVHSLLVLCFFLIARGLPGEAPSLANHFIIVPLAMVTGALPLPLNGLGAMEYVVEFMYRHLPSSVTISDGEGLLVSLGYRVITVAIAVIGMGYYLASRRELTDVLHEVEEESEIGPETVEFDARLKAVT